MPAVEITPYLGDSGLFRIYITPPGGRRRDITFFRGAPVQLGEMSSVDPFGDAAAQIHLPMVTGRDRPGTGDLDWLVPWSNVDIVHYDQEMTPSGWTWEGYLVSEEITDATLSLTLQGALFELDGIQAKPSYPQRPIPYELLIRDAFSRSKHPGLRVAPLVTEWPEDWQTFVPEQDDTWYLRPWGVTPGQKWTGLTTRQTGSWEPLLTGHIQTLLSVMFTEDGGQWTIRKRRGRVPVLMVRPALRAPVESTLEISAGAHGVDVRLTRDFTQVTNVVYGQGEDLAGTAFSGQQVTRDGQTTYYEPFAALPYVYPATTSNPRYLPTYMRRESMLQFPQGLDEISAREVAANQVRKFSDPGYTGTISLSSDPLQGGLPRSRFLIKAGESILVKDVRGGELLFHISEASANLSTGQVSLTVDTKFRDALTVDEVRARTRDALDPVRLLQVGRYSATVQDSVKPWSYSQGSGCIPSGGALDSTEFFTKLIDKNAQFPWTDWTTRYPPKKYPKYYIRIGPKNASANKNWSGVLRDGIAAAAIPIKMSQAGSIRLSQIAAYDRDGNVIPVRFHVGIYASSGVSHLSMPMVPSGGYAGYAAGQRYPFFPGAFERVRPDGSLQSNPNYLLAEGANQVIAWGNYYEPAGYSPGLKSHGAKKTGMLVDETSWSYDTSSMPGFDPYSVKNTQKNPTAGLLYVLIYCDDQGNQPVYFLGRLFAATPGVT